MELTNSTDDQLMATAAHRYCLGRRTYIVGSCLSWLRATWPQFTGNTKQIIVRDTVDAIEGGCAGSRTIDEPGWRAFVAWAWVQLTEEHRVWVRGAVHDSNALTDMLSA